MKREIYTILDYTLNTKKITHNENNFISIETDINNYSIVNINNSDIMSVGTNDGTITTLISTNRIICGKDMTIEKVISYIKENNTELQEINYTLLSAVKWTDANFRPE